MIPMLQVHENTYKYKKKNVRPPVNAAALVESVMGMQELLTAAPADGEPAGAITTFFFSSKAYIYIFYVTFWYCFCYLTALYRVYFR